MKLTPREQQIFVLLSQGKTYKEAGEYLGISINTIRTRVRIFYRKLNAHTIAEAVVNYEFLRQKENLDQQSTIFDEVIKDFAVPLQGLSK